MPAGFLRWEALSLVGPLGDGLFEKVNIQKAFMGAAGFAIEAGLSDATEEEAQIKRLMVQGASEVVAPRRPHEVGAGRVRHVLRDDRHRRRRHRRGRAAGDGRGARRTGVEVHLVERTTDRDVGRSRQIRTGGSAPW